jgi:hypothetical protein
MPEKRARRRVAVPPAVVAVPQATRLPAAQVVSFAVDDIEWVR